MSKVEHPHPEPRTILIERLRAEIQAGTYRVDPDSIADAICRRARSAPCRAVPPLVDDEPNEQTSQPSAPTKSGRSTR